MPVVTSVVIFSGRVSPMPRTSPSLPARDEFAEVAFELFDGAGGIVVGVAAEGVFALEFEQRADLVEDGGDLFFVHGGITGEKRMTESLFRQGARRPRPYANTAVGAGLPPLGTDSE